MRLLNLLITLPLLALLASGCPNRFQPKASATPTIEAVTLTPGLIEPAVGIKEVKLGATSAEIEPVLGEPSARDVNEFVEGQVYLLYHSKGIELTLQDDRVQVITLHAESGNWSAYTGGTPEGVGVGSTSSEIVAALGAAEEQAGQSLTYQKKGLKFRFTADREKGARAETLSLVKPVEGD